MNKIFVMVLLGAMVSSAFGETWQVKCPSIEVVDPFQYKGLWTTDADWKRRPQTGATPPVLMSCSNNRIFGDQMACFYGPHKVSSTQAYQQQIPEGANCQRKAMCVFQCTKQKQIIKQAPKIKLKNIPHR